VISIVLLASLQARSTAALQDPTTVSEHSPTTAVKLSSASLALELDRAIRVLRRGLKENWQTRDQYLLAFEMTPSMDSAGRPVKDAKKYVECAIGEHLQTHLIWDESPPLGVEANRTIIEFTRLRNEADEARTPKDGSSNAEVHASEVRLPPCIVSPRRKVAVSAGVAAGMLKTKTAPVYPADVNVSGTVVLRAIIGVEGRVEALRVISGPVMLQQSALDAVRQWTYRPYRLSNTAVEVETTVKVFFAPRH
jgi:TonB family protein